MQRQPLRVVACGVALLFMPLLTEAVQADDRDPGVPMHVPVLVVKYFPVSGDLIDQRITGDYHYNYQRGASEAVEDHMHQIEAVLNFLDDRDGTPSDQWDKLLFWGRFVGSDRTHKIVRPGCGWSHYPPNAEQDYDWANKRFVETDIEDWKPDGSGKKQRINSDRWGGDSLRWFVYWMQNLPGAGNNLKLSDKGRDLCNWWIFIGDFDTSMRHGLGLTTATVRSPLPLR